jgi:mannose-6-phosphate isomerase-like protein (cupin superfamily)
VSDLPQTVKLQEKFDLFTDHWSPKIVGELNGQQVKLVKISGEFVWHSHDHEDELFLVTRGTLRMRFRDGDAVIGVGEFIIVPRGVEHQPVAEGGEVWILLFEPASTVNTGTAGGERTVTELERL